MTARALSATLLFMSILLFGVAISLEESLAIHLLNDSPIEGEEKILINPGVPQASKRTLPRNLFFPLITKDLPPSHEWTIEYVDEDQLSSLYMSNRSLRVDANGYPHIAYGDDDQPLIHAWRDDISWHLEIVDNIPSYNLNTSLALDSNGFPHISYMDGDNFDLKYAQWTGNEWNIETVDPDAGFVKSTSLALSTTDAPHITYVDSIYREFNLMYAIRRAENGGWQSAEPIRFGGWEICRPTFDLVSPVAATAVNNQGNPSISYGYHYGQWPRLKTGLAIVRWDGTEWHRQSLDGDSETNVGSQSSLAIDRTGNLYISYNDMTNADLKFAHWDSATAQWDFQTVDNHGAVGDFNSLALDSAGNPHISYFDRSNSILRFASWDNVAKRWRTQIVDPAVSVDEFTSLDLDNAGNAHIVYYDAVNEQLKYAVSRPVSPGHR